MTNLIKNHDYTGKLIQVSSDRLRPEHFLSNYTDGEEMGLGDEQYYSAFPEEKIWMTDELSPEERAEFGLEGVPRAWYIVRSYTCWHGWMDTGVELDPGWYKLTIPVYPDVYEWDGKKIPPDLHLDSEWERACRVRLFVGKVSGDWSDEASVDDWYLNPHTISDEFYVDEAGPTRVGIEAWLPWPIKNVGLVLGPWSLERVGEVEPVEECVPPRVQYSRAYILLPQSYREQPEWAQAVALATSKQGRTIGYSADDAGVGPVDRTVIAVNPDEWGDSLNEWYSEHYDGVEYKPVVAATPYEMAVKLLPELTEDIALAQQDYQDEMGEAPGGGTIAQEGCFLTGLAIILRKVYGRDVKPPVLDRLLVMAGAAYWNDNLLDWAEAVKLFPELGNPIKDNSQYTAGDLRQALSDGYEVILRQASPQHFVYLESVSDTGKLNIIDTWDGERKVKNPGDYQGIRAARVVGSVNPTPPEPQYPERYVLAMHAQQNREGLPEMSDSVGGVKMVEDADTMRAFAPETFLIYRNWLSKDEIHRYIEEGDVHTYAEEQIKPYVYYYGDVMNAIEDGLNERIAPHNTDENKKMRDWALEIRYKVSQWSDGNTKTVMLNPGPGAFPLEGEGIEIFDPVFEASHKYGDIIGDHGYIPAIGDQIWLEYFPKRFMKADEYARGKGWFPLWGHTEYGLIGGTVDENGLYLNAGAGWRSDLCIGGDWARHQEISELVLREFIDWNNKHGNRLLIACYFTVGPGWNEFQYYTAEYNDIAALAQALKE